MSTSKEKRQKRYLQKKRHIERQMEICKNVGADWLLRVPHKTHKKKALNCGQPDCLMCANPRKVWGQVTRQEQKFLCESIDDPMGQVIDTILDKESSEVDYASLV